MPALGVIFTLLDELATTTFSVSIVLALHERRNSGNKKRNVVVRGISSMCQFSSLGKYHVVVDEVWCQHMHEPAALIAL